MWSPKITDATIEHLAHIPNMKRISLNEGYITWENGLRHLLRLNGTFEVRRTPSENPSEKERCRPG